MALEAIRVAAIQVNATPDLEENLAKAAALVERAASRGARLAVLPENFAFMGPEGERVRLGEVVGEGPISTWGMELARRHGVEILLGGIPEKSPHPEKVYNTAVLVTPDGVAGTYRKIHLFDIQLEDGPSVTESAHTARGREVVCLDRPWGKLGLSICYDLRFPELYRRLASQGAEVVAIPAGFTYETGRAHWEVLVRARAIENQCFVLAANLVGRHFGSRRSYGHSMIVDPWGRVLSQVSQGDGVAVADLDPEVLEQIRRTLPALAHRVLGMDGQTSA